MQQIRYYLDGTEANPQDARNIRFRLDFRDRRISELEMSVENLTFVREDFTLIKNWLDTYGKGVGMPFSVQFTNGQTKEYILDFLDESFRIRDRSVTCKAILRNGQDNFFKRAEGLTFTNTDKLQWNESDFTEIDYIVVPEAQFSYLISLAIATYSLTQELIEIPDKIVENTRALIEAFTPVGGVPGPNYGAIITASIRLLATIAYTLGIIIALIKLLQEIINIIFPLVRQLKGITYKRLLEKGCEALGYEFESTLLNSLPGLTILPVPLKAKDPSFFQQLFIPNTLAYTEGYPTAQDFSCSTLLRAIEQVENIFYAETKVVDGVVRIEQESYFIQNANQNILRSFTIQDEIQNENGINSEELFKRKVVLWATDPTDFNTLDDTRKSIAEYDTSAQVLPSQDLELFSGYDEVLIDFARGTRKGSLTFLEKAAQALAQAIDTFTNGNLAAKIKDRKNVLQISNLYFSKTKLLYMNGSKLSENQYDKIGADVIGQTYHAPSFVQNNMKDTFEQMPQELTESELFNIIQNNFVNLDNGKVAKFLTVDWSEHEAQANIDFDVKTKTINAETTEINAG